MKKKRNSNFEMPVGKLTKVKDFLPPPSKLIFPKERKIKLKTLDETFQRDIKGNKRRELLYKIEMAKLKKKKRAAKALADYSPKEWKRIKKLAAEKGKMFTSKKMAKKYMNQLLSKSTLRAADVEQAVHRVNKKVLRKHKAKE